MIKEKKCDCWFHRYHVVHICACGKLIDHSQGTMDEHRFHGNMESFPSNLYRHNDTPQMLKDRAFLKRKYE
jgi:hypothetical protein